MLDFWITTKKKEILKKLLRKVQNSGEGGGPGPPIQGDLSLLPEA